MPNPRPEAGLEAFCHYLDRQVRRSADTRGGILGAIIGTSWGLSGALVGILAGALRLPDGLALSALLLGVFGTAGGLVWYYRGRSEDEQKLARIHGETRGLFWKLNRERWQGQLSIAEPERAILEQGALAWRRAIAAFESPLWMASGSESPHSQARQRGQMAIEAAMAQLTALLAGGGFTSSGLKSAESLVAEMTEIADEAQSLVGHLGERGAPIGDVATDLRAALKDLQSLSEAENELRNSVGERDHTG